MPETPLQFEIAKPTEKDGRQILHWRNDPTTLAMFYHHDPKKWEIFWPQYQKEYFKEKKLPPIFALENGERIAFLKFSTIPHPLSPSRLCCDISINVDPQSRGKNKGTRALQLAKDFIKSCGYEAIFAEVREENIASNTAFQKAGFEFFDQTTKLIEDTGENCIIVRYLWEAQRTSPDSKTSSRFYLIDFDGTLADSLGFMKEIYFSLLEKRGFKGSEKEFQELNGPALGEILKILKTRYAITDSLESLSHEVAARLNSDGYSTPLMEGARDFLEKAAERKEICVIVTSSSGHYVQDWLKSKKISHLIADVIGREAVEWHKPHPEPYLLAIRKLGGNPVQGIAIEDSYNGVLSAVRAGLQTYMIQNSSFLLDSKIPASRVQGPFSSWKEIQKEIFSHA